MDGSIATFPRGLTVDRPGLETATMMSAVDPITLGGEPVGLMLRDGSRLNVDLADPMTQAVELARALSDRPRATSHEPAPLRLRLVDGSTLMLPATEILALHLPPERPVNQAYRHVQNAIATSTRVARGDQDVEVHAMGDTRIMRIVNFLPAAVVNQLLGYVTANEGEFQASTVTSNDPEYRKSKVLFQFPEYQRMFDATLRAAQPLICEALHLDSFEIAQVETQLTATYDRGYFKPHNDNSGSLAARVITFVYYFHREPKPFVGGDIRFFDHNPYAYEQSSARHMLDFSPERNSIIFFDSTYHHEVRDVICDHPEFGNSRFTVNGWMHKTQA